MLSMQFILINYFMLFYFNFYSLIEVVKQAGLENVPQNIKKWDVMSIKYVTGSKKSKPHFEL